MVYPFQVEKSSAYDFKSHILFKHLFDDEYKCKESFDSLN